METIDYNKSGLITNIQRFSIHDGPGIRTTVFFKGCPLKCRWCHNPENKKFYRQVWLDKMKCVECGNCLNVCQNICHFFTENGHVLDTEPCTRCGKCITVCPMKALTYCGETKTVKEVIDEVMRDAAFYGEKGGITLSGGESMAQGDFAIELLRAAKAAGITTCVETCGYFDENMMPDLCKYADTILWDIKDTDRERHKQNIGYYPDKIISNLEKAADLAADKITVKSIMIKGITDNDENRNAVIALCNRLGIINYKFFPFHPYGSGKKDNIGDHSSERMGEEYIP